MKHRITSFIATLVPLLCLCIAAPVTGADQPAVVRIWNWNIHDKKYQQKMYKLFNERHPEIKIEYSSISGTVYPQTLEASFVAKQPPDLFYPSGASFLVLREKNLIMPLNEAAPNDAELKKWMAMYPPELLRFVEGTNVFEGKVYVVPLGGEIGLPGYPLFYNKTLFAQSGLTKPPATYSELRKAAAKITQAGQGKYFGIVHGLRDRAGWQRDLTWSLAFAGGSYGSGSMFGIPDMRDGKYHAYVPEFINALKVWIGMREDGSVFPGDNTMEDEQAKSIFATNKAGLEFGGDWNPGNYLAYNPESDFDLVPPPTPDDGIRRGFHYTSAPGEGGGAFGYVMSRANRNPKAAWEVIKFICSLEYQEGYVKGGFGISFMPEANKPENFVIRQTYRFVEWRNDPALIRIGPTLSANAWRAEGLLAGVYPSIFDVLDNIYLGFARDGFESLKDLDQRNNDMLDVAIRKAQEEGVKVIREDFIFSDWDPMKDYVPTKKK